jgi:hypothetical protein
MFSCLNYCLEIDVRVLAMEKLKDCDIRKVLIEQLILEYGNDSQTKIVNEMGILNGKTRVDVAVIYGILHGYEIKSESDTLIRLPSQMEDYNKVFDRVTIVVATKYLNEVRKIIPNWWGIIVVRNKNGHPVLRQVRKGRKNKNVDPYSVSRLLWKEEAIEILKEKGLHKGYLSKPRRKIYEKLVESLPLEELQFKVNELLKERKGWRDREQLM